MPALHRRYDSTKVPILSPQDSKPLDSNSANRSSQTPLRLIHLRRRQLRSPPSAAAADTSTSPPISPLALQPSLPLPPLHTSHPGELHPAIRLLARNHPASCRRHSRCCFPLASHAAATLAAATLAAASCGARLFPLLCHPRHCSPRNRLPARLRCLAASHNRHLRRCQP